MRWPILAAAGVLVMILSLTEVPATVLLSPQHPQPLIPMMMTTTMKENKLVDRCRSRFRSS